MKVWQEEIAAVLEYLAGMACLLAILALLLGNGLPDAVRTVNSLLNQLATALTMLP